MMKSPISGSPLVHLPLLESAHQPCEICKEGDGLLFTDLFHISCAADVGCQKCKLRVLGIFQNTVYKDTSQARGSCMYIFRNPS